LQRSYKIDEVLENRPSFTFDENCTEVAKWMKI
jgi:hypothetical protein